MGYAAFACRKSGEGHFFKDSMAPLRLRRGQGAMRRQGFLRICHTPQRAFSCPYGTIRLTPPNPIRADRGRSRGLPVAEEGRRKPSEQGR